MQLSLRQCITGKVRYYPKERQKTCYPTYHLTSTQLLSFLILIVVHSILFIFLFFSVGVINLTDEELAKHIERSQDDILLSLTPLFEAFLESPYFQEVKEQESREEKRRFSTQSLGPEMRPKEKFVNS